jgi:protocatechuate 3,4-dioxygenase beta subunit
MSMRTAVTAAILTSALTILTGAVYPLEATDSQAAGPTAPTPGQPARMPPRATRPGEDPQKGTAVLRGWVTAADTGNPLRRALVRATSQDGRNSGMTTTDADGRFEIKELLGGRYNLTVSKAGYVSMSYGQRRAEQQGTVLEILDGTLVDKIAFSLPRGGVISGTVLDEFGEPIAGAQVSALRFRYMGGSRRLMASGSAQTDDRGAFRVYGLTPGEYYLSASFRNPQQMMMAPGTVTTGAVDGYAPTYYPGTPNAAEASRISVKAGQESSNVSMALVAARLSRISGRVLNSNGAPVVQGFVTVMAADRMSMGMMMSAPAMTNTDGSFQILGIAPGAYNISVRPRGTPSTEAEFATARITVGAADVDNVMLTTSRGAVARGIITTDEGAPPPMPPEQVQLFAQMTDPDAFMMSSGETKVNADWTFELTGLFDARRIGGSVTQNPDWAVKAVYRNDVDVTDTATEFTPGQTIDGFNVVLTRKRTEISGQILGERNRPETDATIVAFSESPDRWHYATRYIRTARPNQDGRYTLRGLPPHDYLVVAVKGLEPGQFQDPEFLESVRAQAVRVSLAEGESKVQDLKATNAQE